MWFWFGLEILRLVYKKAFFKILNGFYLIWPFNSKKNSTIPYKSWKKFLQSCTQKVSKEAEFCADFKNVQKSRVWQEGKLFFLNWIFRDLENFAKNHFSEKKSLGNSWRKRHIFEISAKFRFFWYPLLNFEEIFFNSYKGRSCFFK